MSLGLCNIPLSTAYRHLILAFPLHFSTSILEFVDLREDLSDISLPGHLGVWVGPWRYVIKSNFPFYEHIHNDESLLRSVRYLLRYLFDERMLLSKRGRRKRNMSALMNVDHTMIVIERKAFMRSLPLLPAWPGPRILALLPVLS